MAAGVVERFGGEVPSAMADLVTLPGVGRKTANVVRSVAFGMAGLPVDTHVQRLSRRLALTEETDPVKVELALNPLVPAADRGVFSLRLILHGRATCQARTPRCGSCVLSDFCPSATERMLPDWSGPGRGRRQCSRWRPAPRVPALMFSAASSARPSTGLRKYPAGESAGETHRGGWWGEGHPLAGPTRRGSQWRTNCQNSLGVGAPAGTTDRHRTSDGRPDSATCMFSGDGDRWEKRGAVRDW